LENHHAFWHKTVQLLKRHREQANPVSVNDVIDSTKPRRIEVVGNQGFSLLNDNELKLFDLK
jgi:hypothetical protein